MGSSLTVTSSNSAFTVTNNTSLSSGTISGSIRVTFKPTTEGIVTGTITVKGTNKAGSEVSTKINVTGKCSLKFSEIWNYSVTSGKAPASGSNWASDNTAMRNIAYGNGKLYTVTPGTTTITVTLMPNMSPRNTDGYPTATCVVTVIEKEEELCL